MFWRKETSKSLQVMKIQSDQIRLGMYVSELDVPWLETPFLFQGFMLEDPDDLMTVRGLCAYVYIDVMKTRIPMSDLQRLPAAKSPIAYPVTTDIQTEIRTASKRYGVTFQHVRALLTQIENGEQAGLQAFPELVRGCVESILHNPSALMWLTRIKHRDQYTAEHCMNVGVLAMALGRQLGIGRKHIELLGLCGMLHDVGKMRLDQKILNKPGRLTAEEFDHIKLHVTYGYEELSQDPDMPQEVMKVALQHHERLDGRGYPKGALAGTLDFYTRVVAIVDAYDAITSRRCYSSPRSSAEALKILYEERGTQFDEKLVVKFIECVGLYPAGALVELSSGEVGVVLAVNPEHRLLPKVALIRDADKRIMPQRVVDLAASRDEEGKPDLRVKSVLIDGSHGIDLEAFTQSNINLSNS